MKMPERVDVLRTTPGNGSFFVADVSVESVELLPNAAGPRVLNSDFALSKFTRGDNFTILSMGYILPESFVLANQLQKSTASFDLTAYKAVSTIDIPLEAVGVNGRLAVPFPNYELNVGTFVDTEDASIDEDFYLRVVSTDPYPLVSMLNVPASFDAETFEVPIFIKVLHNFTLTA